MKTEGIKPRCELGLGSRWQDNPSRPDCVYLSSVYGGFYAMELLARSGAGSGMEVAVVEIDSSHLDQSSLLPDEDFVKQFQDREQARSRKTAMPRRLGKQQQARLDRRHLSNCRDSLEQYAGPGMFNNEEWNRRKLRGWMCSLEGLGVCSYKGTIPPEAITRIAYFGKVAQPIFREFATLPRLTIRNHPNAREYQRRCTMFLFGDFSIADWPDEFQNRAGFSVWERQASADWLRIVPSPPNKMDEDEECTGTFRPSHVWKRPFPN
jgi:hypothetical protein